MFILFCRPVVVEKICELFSLVPGLAVKSDEYEVLYYNLTILKGMSV